MDRNEKQNSFRETRNMRGKRKKKKEANGRTAGLAVSFIIFAVVLIGIGLAVYLYWGK